MVREASGGLCICQKLFCMVKVGYRFFRNIYLFYNVYIVLTHLSFIITNIDKEIRGKRKHDTKIYKYFKKKSILLLICYTMKK